MEVGRPEIEVGRLGKNNMKFEDLEAWQTARALVKSVYVLTRGSGLARDFGVTGQIQR